MLENPKARVSRELFLSENDFKIYSIVNIRKWLKNRNLWFYFYLKYISIQQRWYLTGGNSSLNVIRRRTTEHFKLIKKTIMGAQKCKNILLQAALMDF